MKPARWTTALLALGLVLPALHAVEKGYQAGRIVNVEQKARERVLYYLVNTPVTKDDPYYELSVRLKDTIYLGEYTPRHAADTLPEAWKPDAAVQARVEKHYMFLKLPDGEELQLVIVKRIAAGPDSPGPHANK